MAEPGPNWSPRTYSSQQSHGDFSPVQFENSISTGPGVSSISQAIQVSVHMPFSNSVQLGIVPEYVQGSDSPQQIVAADFNGDGKQDFLITRIKGEGESGTTFTFMINQGDGTWVDQSSNLFDGNVPGTVYAPRVAVADFNGDGCSDVFVPDFGFHSLTGTAGTNQLWLSDGSGGLYVASTADVTNRAHGVTWGDIEQDGDLDIVVNNVNPHSDLVLINDGNGNFTDNQNLLPIDLRSSLGNQLDWHSWSLLADLSGDGAPELVLGTSQQIHPNNQLVNPPSYVLLNDGTGSYASSILNKLPKTPLNPETIVHIDPIDLNGDGLLDLVLSATWDSPGAHQYYGTGYIQLLINQGNMKFVDETAARYPTQVANTEDPWWKFVQVYDFNQDGASDLLLTGAGPNAFNSNQSAKILINDGLGVFSEEFILPTYSPLGGPAGISDVTTASDVDNDGYLDLVTLQWTSPSSLVMLAYLNDFTPQILTGTPIDDSLSGYVGNDVFTGGSGNDTISGGLGKDRAVFNGDKAEYVIKQNSNGSISVTGPDGMDTLFGIEILEFDDLEYVVPIPKLINGGPGNDKIIAIVGDYIINAGGGTNVITVGKGTNIVTAGDGNNTVSLHKEFLLLAADQVEDSSVALGNGNNKVTLGAGNDSITAGEGNDKVIAGEGDNVVDAGNGNNNITTGDGYDDITTGSGNDKIVADDVKDGDTEDAGNLIDAGDGNNNITSGTGDDDITAGSGNDKIVAGNGNNTIDAGNGNNNITAGDGDDTITTGSGNDKIVSGGGNDTLTSGAGKDKITAGAGDDILIGGAGADNLLGGDGSDIFVFNTLAAGEVDKLGDFASGTDTLWFDTNVFTSLDGATADNFVAGPAALDADDHLIFNAGKLYYDADGLGGAAQIQIASIKALAFADLDFGAGMPI